MFLYGRAIAARKARRSRHFAVARPDRMMEEADRPVDRPAFWRHASTVFERMGAKPSHWGR
jgi:hypothetical protein